MASPGMMNRRCTIIKPAPQELNDVGEMVANGDPVRLKVWTSWKEDAGGESLSEEQEYGSDTITLEFWYNRVFQGLDVLWGLEDELGNPLDIISVTEKGGRQVQLSIKAVRRV